ncbi:MAG: hypothetical protein HXY46_03540 [Syntrophaceae bacterium]|nr:hypothetical protein [Syntrophaceae bacterium]
MRYRGGLYIVVFAIAFLFQNQTFSQVKVGETVSFTGMIERVQDDLKFIVIHEMRIFITTDTRIVDENGEMLKVDDLRPKLKVAIEGIRNPNGFLAKRILLKSPKK